MPKVYEHTWLPTTHFLPIAPMLKGCDDIQCSMMLMHHQCMSSWASDQLHFSPTSTPGWVGGSTAVTAKLNCTHCRSTSLQPNFNSWIPGGFNCSHCKVELHSLQINFTSAQLQLLISGFNWGLTALTGK